VARHRAGDTGSLTRGLGVTVTGEREKEKWWQWQVAPFNGAVEGGGSRAGVRVKDGERRRGAWRGGRHRPVADGRGWAARAWHGTEQGTRGC
jgi:hypothetical protein